jgi:hypothetical protein
MMPLARDFAVDLMESEDVNLVFVPVRRRWTTLAVGVQVETVDNA